MSPLQTPIESTMSRDHDFNAAFCRATPDGEAPPPPSNTPARLRSASAKFDFDIPTTSDEHGLEQDGT
jgi:hypothetical protein